jgi:predicted ArsR family transcriptional regulator
MVDRFTCEDAIILVLEEHGPCTTSFLMGRTDFKRETIYVNLRRMEKKGLVSSEELPDWGNLESRWKPPAKRGPNKPQKKWSLVDDGEGRSTEDQG